MAKVDRIVLRIAVYEIAIDRQVPTKAAINESIELAKTFSGEEAGRFVNGILGRVAASVRVSPIQPNRRALTTAGRPGKDDRASWRTEPPRWTSSSTPISARSGCSPRRKRALAS